MDTELQKTAEEYVAEFWDDLVITKKIETADQDCSITDTYGHIQRILEWYRDGEHNWAWHEYSEATQFLCSISCLVSIEKLNEWKLAETFFKTIIFTLGMAGDELGYDYKGLRTIRDFAQYLPYEYLAEIFKLAESADGGALRSGFRYTVLHALIENSSLSYMDDQPNRLPDGEMSMEQIKFRYYDCYLLSDLILKRLRSYLTVNYPDYHHLSISELNSLNTLDVSKTQFLFAVQKGNDFVLVKLDRTATILFFSLTKDPDVNAMNYIFDLHITLEGGRILIRFDTGTAQHPILVNSSSSSFELPFDAENWDMLQFENKKVDSLTKHLFQRLKLSGEERERFDLVCYVGTKLHGLPDRIVYFQNDFAAELADDQIILRKNSRECWIPENFFGKAVNNICAVIGQNGSGKTSVFYSILHDSAFGFQQDQTDESQSFLLYQVGQNYYYSISEGLELENQTGTEMHPMQNSPSGVSICYLSNTFDPFSLNLASEESQQKTEEGGCYADLSAVYQIQRLRQIQQQMQESQTDTVQDIPQQKDYLQQYQEQELQRFRNLAQFMADFGNQENLSTESLHLKPIKTAGDVMPRLSSGEYARWSLFAKLLSVFYRGTETEDNLLPEMPKRDNYIILFDEAELYMHPEWQRTLIRDIIVFLETINENQQFFQNITLLFSSNSPFLMSDLPAEKIRLFSQDSDSKKTFAQNIYSILKDRFFMPNGPMGAFAMQCINQALEVNENSSAEEKEYLKYLAGIVGDDLIAYELKRRVEKYADRTEGAEQDVPDSV